MIRVKLPDAPTREVGSSNVTFRIFDVTDIELLKDTFDRWTVPSVGDLLITLEPSDSRYNEYTGRMVSWDGGYHAIAEIMEKRHKDKHCQSLLSELWDLFEYVMDNSEWAGIPGDDDFCLANGDHMYVDDHGELRVLTGYWKYTQFWHDDPIEKLFVDGYIVLQYFDTDEGYQFFGLPEGAETAWKAGDYDTFRELMEKDEEERIAALDRAYDDKERNQ